MELLFEHFFLTMLSSVLIFLKSSWLLFEKPNSCRPLSAMEKFGDRLMQTSPRGMDAGEVKWVSKAMSSKKAKKRRKKRVSRSRNSKLAFSSYEITYDAIEDRTFKRLPADVRDEIEHIHDMIFSKPGEAISALKDLMKAYPNLPILYNYLSSAYLNIGDREQAEAVVLENYKRHPNYLFAKTNYAQICLDKEDLEQIPIIFNNKFDLKRLYPRRSKFHISEFIAFAGVVSIYLARIGEVEGAEIYYRMLRKMARRHPATKNVKRELHPSPVARVLTRFWKKLEKMAENADTGSD